MIQPGNAGLPGSAGYGSAKRRTQSNAPFWLPSGPIDEWGQIRNVFRPGGEIRVFAGKVNKKYQEPDTVDSRVDELQRLVKKENSHKNSSEGYGEDGKEDDEEDDDEEDDEEDDEAVDEDELDLDDDKTPSLDDAPPKGTLGPNSLKTEKLSKAENEVQTSPFSDSPADQLLHKARNQPANPGPECTKENKCQPTQKQQ